MPRTVSLLVEVPESLHDSLVQYLENRPDWDQDRIFATALSLFMLQNRTEGSSDDRHHQRQNARIYLDSLFKNRETPES